MLNYIQHIIDNFTYRTYVHPMGYRMFDFYVLIGLFTLYEYVIRKDERNPFKFTNPIVRLVLYAIIIISILLFYDDGVNRSFIYFQF